MKKNSQSLQNYVQLMTQHQGALRGFVVSLMPGMPGVSDVLQETNLVLWQKMEKYEDGSNFLAWAFTIARYEVMHHRDRAKRDGRIVFSDKLVDAIAEVDPIQEDNEQHLLALESCMNKLNENQRQLIQHRYSKGQSLENLAASLQKPASALRVSLFRTRAALKKCIENQSPEGRLA